MNYFCCDYHEGAADSVILALRETNFEQSVGYGKDPYCEEARALIASKLGAFSGEIHFVVGGTQANATVIAAGLAPYQGVICAQSGHINVHETGAVEATGHKCLAVEGDELGRVRPEAARAVLETHFARGENEHEVMPGMLYISNTTEVGGIYTKKELKELRTLCDEYGLLLFLDGARLGYALKTPGNDLTLADLAVFCDVFTIGGTKQGLLFGEAIVLSKPERFPHFRYIIKRQGAMLAKGRLLGLQFKAIFECNEYFELAGQAIDQALQIRQALLTAGVVSDVDSLSNQQFFFLPRSLDEALKADFAFERAAETEEGVHVRICTSWATPPERTQALISAIQSWRENKA